MCNLLVLLDEVEPFWEDRVVLVLVLPRLEQDLDHVLHTLLDVALVQDSPKSLKDEVVGLGRVLGEERANLSGERTRDLDRVRGRRFEQEQEQLKGEQLVRDRLVDEMGDERGRREADRLQGNAGRRARQLG